MKVRTNIHPGFAIPEIERAYQEAVARGFTGDRARFIRFVHNAISRLDEHRDTPKQVVIHPAVFRRMVRSNRED